jgi:hypothetical protein
MRQIALATRKLAGLLAVLSAILLPALHGAPAHAQNFHSWVSRSGSDHGNTCAEASPCASFIIALGQTVDGGEVSCLDSGGFFQFTVTISVTIDCTGTMATSYASNGFGCVDGIVINAPGKVVTLRGLKVTAFFGCEANGILIQAAAAVFIEDCVTWSWRIPRSATT